MTATAEKCLACHHRHEIVDEGDFQFCESEYCYCETFVEGDTLEGLRERLAAAEDAYVAASGNARMSKSRIGFMEREYANDLAYQASWAIEVFQRAIRNCKRREQYAQKKTLVAA